MNLNPIDVHTSLRIFQFVSFPGRLRSSRISVTQNFSILRELFFFVKKVYVNIKFVAFNI